MPFLIARVQFISSSEVKAESKSFVNSKNAHCDKNDDRSLL